ncbi:hypothetical protein CANCADRAFT_1206 [Tortispora caseinolytica NRRL Y-17796]|uniref:Dynactin subunit 5 n=1 Tax=Tortispora caseinolytica NRRL Y-17796 TaxID=767744 RepID=A0A1E4TLI1_9ASCO|nr:hypothetical protein CANCADRAFT_1206 [Tortispora caseinolytica NRRL Y-17796]
MSQTTASGNVISRDAKIRGQKYIAVGGKCIINKKCVINGDRTEGAQSIVLGRYCILGEGCELTPTERESHGQKQYFPLKLGSYVIVGENSVVQAASIGSCVYIGKNCRIGPLCIIKEGVVIEDGTNLPANAVVAPFSRVRGDPGVVVEELNESAVGIIESEARSQYAGYGSIIDEVLGGGTS